MLHQTHAFQPSQTTICLIHKRYNSQGYTLKLIDVGDCIASILLLILLMWLKGGIVQHFLRGERPHAFSDISDLQILPFPSSLLTFILWRAFAQKRGTETLMKYIMYCVGAGHYWYAVTLVPNVHVLIIFGIIVHVPHKPLLCYGLQFHNTI